MQAKSDKVNCPVCHKIGKRSTHHILPQRYYHGEGRVFTLCRACHDKLERKIMLAEKLSKERYEEIFNDFIGEHNDAE